LSILAFGVQADKIRQRVGSQDWLLCSIQTLV
jgi:hypothetical protein